MSTTEQPARRPIIPARLAELLQRAMSWRMGARVASQSTIETAELTDSAERERDALPWWATHHPAVSFRSSREEGHRD